MGQRANYILKEAAKHTIYYNHWRANAIASDLFLGEKTFLKFVKECKVESEILEEPWIEGCVVIDIPNKVLYFWSYEFARDTSVVNYYLQQLSLKWVNWKILILKNRMYDVERVLGLNHISTQEFEAPSKPSKEEVLSDHGDWENTLVIIKHGDLLFITQTFNLNAKDIIGYGEDILPLLRTKATRLLPTEGENNTGECIIIDTLLKKIIINESIHGLFETFKDFWMDYQWVIGDFGYIETLQLAGIDTTNLCLAHREIKAQFDDMVKPIENFDSLKFAKKITRDGSDIQFNPNFFDNVKPRVPFLIKLKSTFMKFFGLH